MSLVTERALTCGDHGAVPAEVRRHGKLEHGFEELSRLWSLDAARLKQRVCMRCVEARPVPEVWQVHANRAAKWLPRCSREEGPEPRHHQPFDRRGKKAGRSGAGAAA